MSPITYLPQHKGAAFMVLVGLGLVALCCVPAIAAPDLQTVLLAVVGVPIFGYLAVATIVRLARRTPELTVTDEGFVHRRLGQVSWSEVSVLVHSHHRNRYSTVEFVEVVLHDPKEYLARQPATARMLVKRNARLEFSPVTFTCDTLPRQATCSP